MSDPWSASPPRENFPWQCDICEQPTTLTVLERWWIQPQGDEQDFDPFERAVAKCDRCRMPYVLGRDADYREEDSPLEQLFPALDRPLPRHVPQSIRDSHDEAVRCRRARCHTAAALMARRGVEAICAEQGHREGVLGKKLKALNEAGVIDARLLEWSSVVQQLGNSGAHDVESTLSREDADDAIAFFEALVDYLYTFKKRYEQHLRRKKAETELDEVL